ncbi:glycosyltransferase family 2 protein [Weissella diestrammenae]|uniref:Glycosyltransferase family 2 protein n=1 Tax=Weissella diestrammenae TaxID=1162633 RepID=A0A7G9T5W6_9LACO|nr:glycosyltransferase family 2 protein [Weissella diestrammenae]MCM0582321.1 glycosyltransferase family 2 protein [Weissella diestrammenae]QNN75491.1 glycosyltransferase family 2 protein [Weissella diestrammenae]
MSNKQVTAAIVTYNRLDLLKESLAAVLNQTEYLSHVIVVNNLSTDGTAAYLDTIQDERVIVYNSTENLGGAGGFNKAVQLFAEKLDDEYVWLMDDDTIVEPDALVHLVDFIEDNEHVGFVNSVVRWGTKDGHPSWMNVPAPRGFTWQSPLNSDNPGVEVVNSTFVSVLFSRQMVSMIGLPQKEYFIWGDDMEYTNRIADVNRGYTVLKSVVVHKSKENSMPGDIVREVDASRLWRYAYEFRNRILTARRISKRDMRHSALGAIRFELPRVLLKRNVKYRWQKAKMIVGGVWRGIWFNPKIEFAAGMQSSDVRSINAILRAYQLAHPTERMTLDREIELINHCQLEDLKGINQATDRFIMDYKVQMANKFKK